MRYPVRATENAYSFQRVTNEEAHRLAREKGVSRWLYALVRGIVSPLFRAVLPHAHLGRGAHPGRGRRGRSRPNHKSFWDSFFIGVCTRRHLRFMAKTELIEARYGRLLVRLGAFPVRRGQADEDALETARAILRQGGLLALFPEGTRIRDPDQLGNPRRGAGPAGARDRRPAGAVRDHRNGEDLPRRRAGPAAGAGGVLGADPGVGPGGDAGGGGDADLGDAVARGRGEYRRLRARPTLIAAGLAALGIGGGLLARSRPQAQAAARARSPTPAVNARVRQPWISQPSVARAASMTASANDGCAWMMRATSG